MNWFEAYGKFIVVAAGIWLFIHALTWLREKLFPHKEE